MSDGRGCKRDQARWDARVGKGAVAVEVGGWKGCGMRACIAPLDRNDRSDGEESPWQAGQTPRRTAANRRQRHYLGSCGRGRFGGGPGHGGYCGCDVPWACEGILLGGLGGCTIASGQWFEWMAEMLGDDPLRVRGCARVR